MFPPHPFPIDSIRVVPGVTPLQIPPENLPVIRSWTTLQQRVALPQPQGCLGYSESVPVDFVPNRPSPQLLHPPRRQSGAISRVRFSSASPVLCQMWFELLSQLGPLSRIWQETSMSQHQRMHLNRILDNVAPGTAMKYISSCKSFFKTCKALQVDLISLTEVQLADILITMSLSRSTSHGSSSCSSVIKALRWLLKSAEVGCLQVVHSVLTGTFLNQKVPRDRKQAPPLPLWGIGAVGASCAHVQLHGIGNYFTGYIFIDGLGIPSFLRRAKVRPPKDHLSRWYHERGDMALKDSSQRHAPSSGGGGFPQQRLPQLVVEVFDRFGYGIGQIRPL